MVREAISLALTAVLTAAAADLRVSSLSDGVAIDPLFVGLNNDSSLERDPWTSETVRAALTKTRSGTLRYPGGTPGNYWDMRGQVMFQPGAAVDLARGIHTQTRYTMGWVASVSPVRQPNTVEELAKAYAEMKKAGPAGIIFTLNMITPGADYYAALWGRAVNQSPGSADWWAMLDDRYARNVEMLDRAQAAGIPIRYIEFGNEYHFGAGPGGSATAGAVVEPYSAGTWTTPPITGASLTTGARMRMRSMRGRRSSLRATPACACRRSPPPTEAGRDPRTGIVSWCRSSTRSWFLPCHCTSMG